MKWPTMDEFAKSVAEKALDEIEYNGKTLREWMEIIETASEDTISRRAAIEALTSKYDVFNRKDNYITALKTIRDELPPVTYTKINPPSDYARQLVSRKDCLQALSHLMDVDGFRDGWAVSRANVECMLKAMPPVTPKQRTGHWIPVGVAEVVGGESAQWGSAVAYHKCSACDEQALRDDFEEEVLSKWCPHCGAKMEWVSE